jgi:hypothetical protein
MIFAIILINVISCSSSPESSLKNVDFDKVKAAVDEEDKTKSKEIMSQEIESVGKLCESLKAKKIEMKHVDAVDVYRRLEFMMALGGFYRVQEALKGGTIREISQKDREEIKYICDKLVFDAEEILKEKAK